MKNLIAMVMMVMLVMTTTSCGSHEANEKPEIQTSVSSVSENEPDCWQLLVRSVHLILLQNGSADPPVYQT